MDMFDIIFFRTGICALFMATLVDKPRRSMPREINHAVLALMGLCMWNLFVHTFAPVALSNFLNLFLAIVGFYTVYAYLDETKNIIKYILIAGAINLCFAISQRLGFDPVFDKVPQIGGGFLGNVPRLANYFTLIIPFLSFPLVLASTLLVWFTGQFVILIPISLIIFKKIKHKLMFSTGFSVFNIIGKKRIPLIMLAGVFMFITRAHIYNSFVETRIDRFWIPALKALFNQPLIGYGMGNTGVEGAGSVFSSYLQFIVGVGILGAVWFGYVFKGIYKKIKNNTESIAFATLALLMLIEYAIEPPREWFLIIGIILIFILKTEEPHKEAS